MKNNRKKYLFINSFSVAILLFFILENEMVISQEYDPWVFEIGINVVDNSGSRFDELLNIKNNWNLSKSIRASIEKRFDYDFGAVVGLSLNEFAQGKNINSIKNYDRADYFAIDIMLKAYVSNYWHDRRHAKYDFYLAGGWGGNFFNRNINNTINLGLGLNIKMREYIWISFQTLGKFSIDNNTAGNANHLQHSASMIFWLQLLK